jgi:hypothetical protein
MPLQIMRRCGFGQAALKLGEAAMDSFELLDPQELVRLALSELKNASTEVPTDRRRAIEEKIKRAEEMLAMARSKSAKELGFRLHDCKYPPALFLWDQRQDAHICEGCGHVRPNPKAARVSRESSWVRSRPGDGTGWMNR